MPTIIHCLKRASFLFSYGLLLVAITGGCDAVTPVSDESQETTQDSTDDPTPGQPVPDGVTLDVPVVGQGTVQQAANGSLVTLTATPAPGWAFSGWVGTTNSNQNPITLNVSATTAISAVFIFPPPPDEDGDGVPDADDACPDFDDSEDADDDGIPDACDDCPNDDANDVDDDDVCGDIDNCPTIANSLQIDGDDDGVGDVCDDCPDDAENDTDEDGVCADDDNCPDVANANQADADSDDIGDACDDCPNDDENDADSDGVCGDVDICEGFNDSADADADGIPDGCDDCPNDSGNDADDDGVCGNVDLCEGFDDAVDTDDDGDPDGCDNCPDTVNADQADQDEDDVGDACDNCVASSNGSQADGDADGIGDACDNCPNTASTDQTDTDSDNVGDVCDNCPTVANGDQADADSDGIGDACELDGDSDGIEDDVDNCPTLANADQEDTDGDGDGDACDNCVNDVNANQADFDADGIGDVCDNCPQFNTTDQTDDDADGVGNRCDLCADTPPGTVVDTDGCPNPVAVISRTIISGPDSPVEVTFDVAGSFDPLGGVLTFSWLWGDGSPVETLVLDSTAGGGSTSISHTYTIPPGLPVGTIYTPMAILRGSSGTQTVWVDAGVTVLPRTMGASDPQATFTIEPDPPVLGEPFRVNASSSVDFPPGGNIASYNWDFGDGSDGTGFSITHTYANPGTYTIRLTVLDEEDPPNMGEAEATVVVDGDPAQTWWSAVPLFALPYYTAPEQYDFDGSGNLLSVNTILLEQVLPLAFQGGDFTVLSTDIPRGIVTTTFEGINMPWAPGETLIEQWFLRSYHLDITPTLVTWTFDIGFSLGVPSSTSILFFAGQQIGEMSPAADQINWHTVGAVVTQCVSNVGCGPIQTINQRNVPLGSWTLARPSICGNTIVEPGEECDPPDGITCDSLCQDIALGGDDPPANDSCDNPIAVTDGTIEFSNVNATTDGINDLGICSDLLFDMGSDIWFCYEATCNGFATISLCGSDYDTMLAAYDSCDCPTAAALDCDDDTCTISLDARLNGIPVTVGESYMIRVGGFSGLDDEQGNGLLTISCGDDPGTLDACTVDAGDCFSEHAGTGCGDTDCCTDVCLSDPFCCDLEWDDICVELAHGFCGSGFSACNSNSNDCQMAQNTPGCDDELCCNDVCMDDPFCCLIEWDGTCVDSTAACTNAANTLQTPLPSGHWPVDLRTFWHAKREPSTRKRIE